MKIVKKNVVSQIEIKIAILNILAVLYNNNLLVNECGNVDNYKIEYIKKSYFIY